MTNANKLWGTLLAILVMVVSACGGGSSVAPGTNPDNDYGSEVPDIVGTDPGSNNGGDQFITIEQRYPTPYESGDPQQGIHIDKYKIPVADLITFNDPGHGTSFSRGVSAVLNMDSELMYPTLNAAAVLMYDHQDTVKTVNGGLGSWQHVFLWDSTDANANRNTQGVTWLGLINADKLHDIKDGPTKIDDDIAASVAELLDRTDPDGAGPLPANGFLGHMYNLARAADVGDNNPLTSADRPFPYEVVLCIRAANYLNDPQYDLMGQAWFEGTTDELSGDEEVDRLLAGGRASLTLWDCESRIRAAALTQNYDWAEDMIAQLDATRGSWDGMLLGGWDYTPLGWEAIGGAIAELKLQAGSISPLAQSYLDEAIDKLKGDENHHSVVGYYGFEVGGRTYDDSQQNAYAFQSIANLDYYVLSGTDATLLSRGNRALEFYKKRVLQYSSGFDIDGVGGADDAGAILNGYRGPLVFGGLSYNYEVTGEWLNGASELASIINRYPDTPLY